MSWMIFFSHMIAGGRLRPKEEGLGRKIHIGVIPQLVIQVDDVQDIEQLALVLMEALYLDVKDGVGVQRHSGLTGHIGGEAALVLLLDGLQAVQHGGVVLDTSPGRGWPRDGGGSHPCRYTPAPARPAWG